MTALAQLTAEQRERVLRRIERWIDEEGGGARKEGGEEEGAELTAGVSGGTAPAVGETGSGGMDGGSLLSSSCSSEPAGDGEASIADRCSG